MIWLAKARDTSGAGGLSLKLATANVGSLKGKVEGLLGVGDLICMQETMVTHEHARSVRAESRSYGMDYVQGRDATTSVDSLGRRQAAKGQGLGVLPRNPRKTMFGPFSLLFRGFFVAQSLRVLALEQSSDSGHRHLGPKLHSLALRAMGRKCLAHGWISARDIPLKHSLFGLFF